jgi:molybdopterin-guanine dinucleotide biosynthesis protein A
MTLPPVSALLLAGGQSRRMGTDKALLPWQGTCLWQAQVAKLHALRPHRLLIACREAQGLASSPGAAEWSHLEWIHDPPEADLGPMAMIQQALAMVHTPLLVLAVDMPWMTPAYLQQHCQHGREGIGWCLESPAGLEPMAALYVPGMLPIMKDALMARRLSLQLLWHQAITLGLAESRPVTSAEHGLLANTNTPVEWEHEKGRSEGPAFS